MDAPIGHLNPKGEAWQSRARLLEENQIEMPPFGCLNLILCQGLLDLKKIEVCEVYPSWKTKTLIFEHQTQSKIGNSPQFSERHLFSDWVCRIRHPHVTQKRRGDSETTMEVKNMPYSFCRKIIVLERNFGLGWYHMTPKLALWLSQHKPFCKKKCWCSPSPRAALPSPCYVSNLFCGVMDSTGHQSFFGLRADIVTRAEEKTDGHRPAPLQWLDSARDFLTRAQVLSR